MIERPWTLIGRVCGIVTICTETKTACTRSGNQSQRHHSWYPKRTGTPKNTISRRSLNLNQQYSCVLQGYTAGTCTFPDGRCPYHSPNFCCCPGRHFRDQAAIQLGFTCAPCKCPKLLPASLLSERPDLEVTEKPRHSGRRQLHGIRVQSR